MTPPSKTTTIVVVVAALNVLLLSSSASAGFVVSPTTTTAPPAFGDPLRASYSGAESKTKFRNPSLFGTASDSDEDGGDDGGFFFAVEASPSSPSGRAATTLDRPPATSSSSSAVVANGDSSSQLSQSQSRILGSQELLMLPRQYGPSSSTFPQMNHVSTVVLSATPTVEALTKALEGAMSSHPLLRCRVEGSGEPEERIDLFEMVRKGGEEHLERFVCPEENFPVGQVLTVIDVVEEGREALDGSWRKAFNKDLDDGSWCDPRKGPFWKIELHRLTGSDDGEGEEDSRPCALVFTFNHAISDQASVNVLTDQILSDLDSLDSAGVIANPAIRHTMPNSLEDSVLGLKNRWSDVTTKGLSLKTIEYVAGKAAEGLKNPVILPDDEEGGKGGGAGEALTIISGRTPGGGEEDSEADGGGPAGTMGRASTLQFRSLSSSTTSRLVDACRANSVTITNALSAAMALTSSDFIDNGVSQKNKRRNYKVLQSLDMRRFGEKLDDCETVACMAGSMDLMHGPIPDRTGEKLRSSSSSSRSSSDFDATFWSLAREGRDQTSDFVSKSGPEEAVRVFDFAMTISDMNNLVHLTASSKDSLGRAYSAGISNVGVYERQKGPRRVEDKVERRNIQIRHGKYKVEEIYFATSHARTGCLYQASAMTVDGSMQIAFHPASPIVSEETNAKFADAFVELLKMAAGEDLERDGDGEEGSVLGGVGFGAMGNPLDAIPEHSLTRLAAALGVVGIGVRYPAWHSFFTSLLEMKSNVASDDQFWAAFDFWTFFAVGHPLLTPILWISDVLHGSPGPSIGDLVPASFLIGNLIVIGIVSSSKEIRNALNVAALSAFLAYVGAGLDGRAGLGDYNLQLDDSYQGRIVKGCPSYDDVRQSTMDGFDLEKYQGKWYEQKFHDWTQFKEVYDTTLDIKLTPDGKGWTDDFGVKGPSPDAAPLSWDKSPVANGAHYFLFGRVDERDPPGVLRESGFGVEFPNYIVDVQKDPKTGEYTEAIQFQCLERGGVRVFEGINFMSRKPVMSEDELNAMHERAERAGMNPYGASVEQMHTVARRGSDEPELDNSWQAMWRAIGVDRLLELLTESIEDGGR